ncbi:ABC transporter permease [Anaeromyxobacter oryzae]|uniref:ABC transporter permease n=1 Tax=Anaeromyxobacter oryzae TaxID=2918170 RepID=UPI0020C0AFDB|nr:ABC transporter permease [Anaeromyxobacter oryzae]
MLALFGPLDVWTAPRVRRDVAQCLADARIASLDVDVTGLGRGDMSGMAILYELTEGRFTPGVTARLVGLRPELAKILAPFCPEEPPSSDEGRPRPLGTLEAIGSWTIDLLHHAREHVAFLGAVAQAFAATPSRPRTMRWSEVSRVFDRAGVDAVPIVSLISFLTGLIIAFEAAQTLATLGAQIYVANTIGLVMVRELGPIMTAVVLAGRSGSAFAAELGTMKVNEELDALETMGLDPVRFLVIQRVLAGTLLTPLLTAYAMAVGVLGGATVMLAIGFHPALIWQQLVAALRVSDVVVGLSKGLVFGVAVATIGCQRGMETGEGPSAVGVSTTRAVVAGILSVVLIDSLFTALTYLAKV